MQRSKFAGLAALLLGVAPQALLAQIFPDEDGAEEIVVVGQPERGSVIGNVLPEQQFRPADIRALGAATIADLLDELAPQTDSGGGAPVVLLNGKRISGFAEIRDLPTEAIARVDLLPEEVALSYGYSPNQKVVNIVLRPRFRAEVGEARGGLSTDGGRENGALAASLLRIRNDNRFTLDLKYARSASLLESQRSILSTAPQRPYAIPGNITALAAGAEIDPALSALAGEPVLSAAVPEDAAAAPPTLADFLVGANRPLVSDLSRFRTLSPATENFVLNATLARALGGVSATVNAQLQRSESDSLQGLPSLLLRIAAGNPFSPFASDVQLYRYLDQAGALAQRNESNSGQLGLTLNGGLMPGWQWSFTGNAELAKSRTRTERGFAATAAQAALDAGAINPYGPLPAALLADRLTDTARSTARSVGGDLLLSGTVFSLPAGMATTSLRLGASADGVRSDSLRSGLPRQTSYASEVGSGQLSIDLPLTSRRRAVLDIIGDTSVNLNAAVRQQSDFGTLATFGYGLRWTPVPAIRVQLSANQDRSAPSGQQLNNPLLSTPNVSVFDYARGETVLITQLSGGNPALRESVRDRFRLNTSLKPFAKPDLRLTASYLNSRTRDPIASLPSPTPAIEAAFPDRFLRDADGMLVQIDSRPVNYARAKSERIRWGVDLSIPLKSAMQRQIEAWRAAGGRPEDRPAMLARPPAGNTANRARPTGDGGDGGDTAVPQGEARPQGIEAVEGAANARAPGDIPGVGVNPGSGPGSGPRRGPGGGFGGGDNPGSGRLQFGLYHNWHLSESILIAPGVPALDLLDGDASGSSGGQPRHEIEARFGYSNNGLGLRLSANWESGTHVNGALGGTSRLAFGSLATADLRLFADLSQMPALTRAHPFLRGARLSFAITNLWNERRSVTDATGATPIRYQPGYLDPTGRAVTISFRKLFLPAFQPGPRPRGS